MKAPVRVRVCKREDFQVQFFVLLFICASACKGLPERRLSGAVFVHPLHLANILQTAENLPFVHPLILKTAENLPFTCKKVVGREPTQKPRAASTMCGECIVFIRVGNLCDMPRSSRRYPSTLTSPTHNGEEQVGPQIGQGSFALVHKGRHLLDNSGLALTPYFY